MGWNRNFAKTVVKQTRKEIGDAWGQSPVAVTPDTKEAFLARRVLSIVIGQDSETISRDDIEALYFAVLEEAGLKDRPCTRCGGTGADPENKTEGFACTCRDCGGTGRAEEK
jgi:hypothetical protein